MEGGRSGPGLPRARLSPIAESRYYVYVTLAAERRGIRERDLVAVLELELLIELGLLPSSYGE